MRKAHVSIPQAVGAVATVDGECISIHDLSFNTASGRCCCNQTAMLYVYTKTLQSCFNTASGRCCCNLLDDLRKTPWYKKWFSFNTASGRCCCNAFFLADECTVLLTVSIPQAVGAVATKKRQRVL